MSVREALPQDFNEILDMCSDFWNSTIYEEPFNRDFTALRVNACFDHGLLCVADHDGEIVGFMSGLKSETLCSPEAIIATELAWFVKPDFRRHGYGIELINTFENLALREGVKYLTLGYMYSSMPEIVKSIYGKLGYRPTEETYTKVIRW